MGEYVKPMVLFECKTHGVRIFLNLSQTRWFWNMFPLQPGHPGASAQVGPGMSRALRVASRFTRPTTDEIGRWKMCDAAGTGAGTGVAADASK